MFQRLKGNLDSFLDNKIAEEQARQQNRNPSSSSPASAQRSASRTHAGRGNGRAQSPPKRSGPGRSKVAEIGNASDPDDFVIGDDVSDVSAISRTATPALGKAGPDEKASGGATPEGGREDGGEAKGRNTDVPDVGGELPEDVRKRLARLETLTAKYQDLLRNYRTAHARVAAIEPFEATLREHTPLTSIAEPGALVEYLNQRSLQSDMVMEELKRVAGEQNELVKERDELKLKLQDAEKRAKEAFDEAAGLRKEREEKASPSEIGIAPAEDAQSATDPLVAVNAGQNPPTTHVSAATATGAQDEAPLSSDAEPTSLQARLQEQENEIKENRNYINELETENATLRNDLNNCQDGLQTVRNKVEDKDREINEVRTGLLQTQKDLHEAKDQEESASASLAQTEAQLDDIDRRYKHHQKALEDEKKVLQKQAEDARAELEKHQKEHKDNLANGTYSQRDEKRYETMQNLVTTVRTQLTEAENGKRAAENKAKDLQFEMNKLEGESKLSSDIIKNLRGQQEYADRLKKELSVAEVERDDARKLAETKKGHESAVASLRSQLKKAMEERDSAYQIIIDCGKCQMPAKVEESAPEPSTDAPDTPETRSRGGSETVIEETASTQPTETSTPGAEDESVAGGEGKKKAKKKKSKTKKKSAAEASPSTTSPEITVEELIAHPKKAQELIGGQGSQDNLKIVLKRMIENPSEPPDAEDEKLGIIRQLEHGIEERDQAIRYSKQVVSQKDTEIDTLRTTIAQKEEAIDGLNIRLREVEEAKEELQDECDGLRDQILDVGKDVTSSKQAKDDMWWQKQRLQDELDDLQTECDRYRKKAKDLEGQHGELQARHSALETEITSFREAEKTGTAASTEELRVVREQLETTQNEAEALRTAKQACEKQIEELRTMLEASGAESLAKHESLATEHEELRSKTRGLEADLAFANQLAQSRFKDVTDLREHLNKVQPELKKLREECEEVKKHRDQLEKANAVVAKLEGKERDLRSEIAEYRSQAADRDGQLARLSEEAKKQGDRSSALESTYEQARKDLEQNERARDEAVEAREKLRNELDKAQEELKGARSKLEDVLARVKQMEGEAEGLRYEVQMKTAQQASLQSLADGSQDQQREMATQLKEARQRCESLDEELADAHRLLGERSREGETMRRLLGEVEGRAEARVKEMGEKMELALEERDRAEDEAASTGRRKTREAEELRNRAREAGRELDAARTAQAEAERRERQAATRQQELERTAAQARDETERVRSAMAQLRETLDATERQWHGLERERAELRRAVEDKETRLDRLQKSSRAMADELRALQQQQQTAAATAKPRQQAHGGGGGVVVASGGSSRESSRSRVPMSPAANGETTVDTNYLKNVLLQFLEQKEKKHQMQLVPVLGMLLHFDKQDESKWMSAISAR